MSTNAVVVEGTELTISCKDDETLLNAALRQGIGFPYECNSGGCGSCYFDLLEGDMADLWPQAPGLSERSRSRGRRLACQSIPNGSCKIKARLSEEYVPKIRPQRSIARLTKIVTLTHDMKQFSLETEFPADFLAGQFALLRFPGLESWRAYSMSNNRNDQHLWEFIIKRVPNGKGTGLLFDAMKVGDTLTLDGPYGLAYLRTDAPRDIVCVGGGSGLSPMMAIARAAAAEPALRDRAITMFYGGRAPRDLAANDLFNADPALKARVKLVCAVSDDAAADAAHWQGERGFIHEVLMRHLQGSFTANEYYFCGPPPMTNALQNLLVQEQKVPLQQLHFDRFF
uniref:PAH dioxygenase component ferredoxin reductase n=1 Tax=uncultured bacterium UPO33 TaxID=1776960 RepID=A0A126SXD2_9BACT|nr:PAH dioxygenase component ferredoxin reductase [uncultured bacterium UPO33]